MSAWLETETVASGMRVLGKYWDRPRPGPAGRAILAQKAMAMLLTGQPAERVRSRRARRRSRRRARMTRAARSRSR